MDFLKIIMTLLLAPTIAAGKGKGYVTGLGLIIIAAVLIVALFKVPAVFSGGAVVLGGAGGIAWKVVKRVQSRILPRG